LSSIFTAATNALMQRGNEAAESMAEIMRAIFEPLIEPIYGHGGFVTGFAGDAFTALFPTNRFPEEREAYNHALAAAIAIRQHMVTYPVHNTPYGGFPFAIN
jgi:class 3 adenylate cyclase